VVAERRRRRPGRLATPCKPVARYTSDVYEDTGTREPRACFEAFPVPASSADDGAAV
jgi:hypothetical protein